MIVYRIYHGHGRARLASDLGADDPFSLDPRAILERVTALGCVPDVEHPRFGLEPHPGQAHVVSDGPSTYRVTIGRDAETITVEEMRQDGDGYEGDEGPERRKAPPG